MPEDLLEKSNQSMTDREGKYLTFALAHQEYGLEITKVKEIIGVMEVTTVPQTPDYVAGVINLRGKIIPVINLRLKFGLEFLKYTERTCIIVAEINGKSGSLPMGMVVDSVSEVLNIKKEEMEQTPNFGVKLDTEYIMGMAKTRGKVIILLDINRVLNVEGLLLMEGLRSGEEESPEYLMEEES